MGDRNEQPPQPAATFFNESEGEQVQVLIAKAHYLAPPGRRASYQEENARLQEAALYKHMVSGILPPGVPEYEVPEWALSEGLSWPCCMRFLLAVTNGPDAEALFPLNPESRSYAFSKAILLVLKQMKHLTKSGMEATH